MVLDKQLKTAIDAPITFAKAGGVGQAILGLIHALGQLDDGDESYTIIVESGETKDWLRPFAGPNQEFVIKPHSATRRLRTLAKRGFGPVLPVVRRLRHPTTPPISDGFYESLACHVLHFPHQKFVHTQMPTIYNPHDLLHVHYPQFLSKNDIAWRETVYADACRSAQTVVVASQWVKDDCVQHFRLDPRQVQVIPWGAPTQAYPKPTDAAMRSAAMQYHLPQPFALYPAMTWPHKNHLKLLEALACLRNRRGLTVRLVCTGTVYEPFWPKIKSRLRKLNLSPQVTFLGFVPEEDLRAVYHLAQFLVVPTLFESDSFPIYEAWLEDVPVACSDVTSLPDQVGDAALLFNPDEVSSIADAVHKIATQEQLRGELRERGRKRLKGFDWQRTAKAYRAVYRRAAGYTLTEEDHWLLNWDWMRQPSEHAEAQNR